MGCRIVDMASLRAEDREIWEGYMGCRILDMASLRAQDREMCEKVMGLCGNAGYMVINVKE